MDKVPAMGHAHDNATCLLAYMCITFVMKSFIPDDYFAAFAFAS